MYWFRFEQITRDNQCDNGPDPDIEKQNDHQKLGGL